MHHCGRFIQTPLTRRQMLTRCASGFGAVALAGLGAALGLTNILSATLAYPMARRTGSPLRQAAPGYGAYTFGGILGSLLGLLVIVANAYLMSVALICLANRLPRSRPHSQASVRLPSRQDGAAQSHAILPMRETA